MFRKALCVYIFVLFMAAVAYPEGVSAGVDSLASPTLQLSERIAAPEIIGVNLMVLMSEGNQGDTHPSDIYSPLLKFHGN